MPINNGEIEENPTPVATDQENGNIETPAPEVEDNTPIEGQPEEKVEDTPGDEPKPEAEKAELPKHFREGYEALERDVKEKYKPLAEAVEALGGMEVINALKPIAELALSDNVEADQVVSTLKEVLIPEHLEALAWSALDNPSTQEVVLNDPDVQAVIAEKFFNGRSLEEVQQLVEALGADEELDPEKAELRKQINAINESKRQEELQRQQYEANQRVEQLQKRFYVDTADEVLKRFSLNAPEGASQEDKQLFDDAIEDIRYAAQGRFLRDHSSEYLQIQDMYGRGLVTQARVAEARLQNKWQATLIKTAERHSKQLQAVSASRRNEQQQKVANTRPDITGNAPNESIKKDGQYDLSDPNWLNQFLAEFKADAATR